MARDTSRIDTHTNTWASPDTAELEAVWGAWLAEASSPEDLPTDTSVRPATDPLPGYPVSARPAVADRHLEPDQATAPRPSSPDVPTHPVTPPRPALHPGRPVSGQQGWPSPPPYDSVDDVPPAPAPAARPVRGTVVPPPQKRRLFGRKQTPTPTPASWVSPTSPMGSPNPPASQPTPPRHTTTAQVVTSVSRVPTEPAPAPTGPTSPQPFVPAPQHGLPLSWVTDQAGLWIVGAHGGAGETTFAALDDRWSEAGHAWPVTDHSARCLLVARTSVSGLTAAQDALTQWASSSAGPSARVVGLVLMADAPGKVPPPIRDLIRHVGGGAPHVWQVPWVEAWRLGAVGVDTLPKPVRSVIGQIHSVAAQAPA